MSEPADRYMTGVALSDGCAVGRVCLLNEERHNRTATYKVSAADVPAEVERLAAAVAGAAEQLEAVRQMAEMRLGPAEAEIFVAQRTILEDASVREMIVAMIENESVNAETAVAAVLDGMEARLAALDSALFRQRASDIGEIKHRLLHVLTDTRSELQCGASEHCRRGRHRIVVAGELTAGLAMELDTAEVLGFVAEHGGRDAHGAILARALGIPAVGGILGVRDRVTCGAEILVDGTAGEVIVWPMEPEIRRSRAHVSRLPDAVAPLPGVAVMANISLAAESADALAMQADGIGLYRTEFELLSAGQVLEEDELFARYAGVIEAMAGRPVVFRLFDVGSDKPLPSLRMPAEDNPSLGWRGGRLLLARPELVRIQARALARAAALAPIRVLYPMIVDVCQFAQLRQLVTDAAAPFGTNEKMTHGAMFEVPSACLDAAPILDMADFGSIGTNDLIQYLFAVDRGNENVANDYRPDHPALWRVLASLTKCAAAAATPLSVCGELAGEPQYAVRLVQLGIRCLSVNTRQITDVRRALRRARLGTAASTRIANGQELTGGCVS